MGNISGKHNWQLERSRGKIYLHQSLRGIALPAKRIFSQPYLPLEDPTPKRFDE